MAPTNTTGSVPAESSATSGPGVSPGGTSTSSVNREPVLCVSCGQFHDPNTAHLYDYNHSSDAELMCRLCQKPLVDPLDTKCGHTFCTPCLKNHLAVQALCPIDKQIINFLECQQASQIVRNLLDKLLVVCPNVDYCEEVLPRCELESHLLYRCRGAVTRCIKAHLGCTFRGPRTALQSHLWECPFRSEEDASLEAEMAQQVVAGPNKNPVVEGAVTEIEIPRGCFDLGLSFVGGCDTPLMCIVVQEVYIDGIVARDGRLRPGDQILEVNDEDLTQATHSQAKRALSQLNPTCKLTVYREKSEESVPIEKEERLRIVLSKRSGRNLGIKIVGKKNCAGLFILGLVSDGLAELDGRLMKDDRILEINSVDLRAATQEEAAEVIRSADDKVCFLVSRRTRPQTPDIIQSVPGQSSGGSGGCPSVSSLANDTGIPMLDYEFTRNLSLSRGVLGGCGAGFREQVRYGSFAAMLECSGLPIYIVTVSKSAGESLGMSVAGGVASQRGDIPVYVTNLQPDGVLGRTKQIKKGDIVLFVNDVCLLSLSHEQAVRTLKQASIDSREVTVHILDGPETSSGAGNFMPSWVYWLQLPRLCMLPRLIEIERDANGSLGFSIVGGRDREGVLTGPPQPIIVKSIVPGGPAHRDGRLRCGDILVAANEYPLTDVEHSHAVQMLKLARGVLHLRVVSWPGTIV